jgi:hypothetical protein
MWFFASLIPATIWVVLGYFISSTKSEGRAQKVRPDLGRLGVYYCRASPGDGCLCNPFGFQFRGHDETDA